MLIPPWDRRKYSGTSGGRTGRSPLVASGAEAGAEIAAEVRDGVFPDAEHSYGMQPDEVAKLEARLGKSLR